MPSEALRSLSADARFRRWFGAHFAAAVALFFLGTFAGFAVMQTVTPEALTRAIEGGDVFPDQFTAVAIAVNNLVAVGVTALGLVTFGVVAAVSLLFNGLILGAVFGAGLESTSPAVLLALVVPHGVVELPAFWLVGALSFRVTHRLVNYLRGVEETILTRVELFEVAVLLAVTALLILIAAVVEAHVTPPVAEALTGVEV